MQTLTERQIRELEYHREHARSVAEQHQSVDFEPVVSSRRRWWNAFWDAWTFLINQQLRGKKVLVVGCGAGLDALLFAKRGAVVSAFDLSPEMLAHGIRLAQQQSLRVDFAEMTAEQMTYRDATFDIIYCRDILHHVNISATMGEIVRVAKPGALFLINEIYSHSLTDIIRHSAVVERMLYPAMQRFIYKGLKPYITEDERKLTQEDIGQITLHLRSVEYRKYFNFLVTRIVPDNVPLLNKVDRVLLACLGPLGGICAGRIVLAGHVK